jgi:putative ABC transport system substrate-binding protein
MTHLEKSLLEGLRQKGYVAGRNLVIVRRNAEGSGMRRLRAAADELAALKLDAVLTTCSPSTQAMRQATRTLPLVMAGVSDPVGQGFVDSLRHPGGNVTGVAARWEELAPKMLQLAREVVPNASRVAVFLSADNPWHDILLEKMRGAARALHVRLAPITLGPRSDLEATFADLAKQGTDLLIVLPDDPMLTSLRKRIAALALARRMPSLFGVPEAVEDGGLMSYGEPLGQAYFRAAHYLDRIAKGARPADLPVDTADRFDLIVNAGTARALKIAIPQSILLRADRVIE